MARKNPFGSTLAKAMAEGTDFEEDEVQEPLEKASGPTVARAIEAIKEDDKQATRMVSPSHIHLSPLQDRIDPEEGLEPLVESIRAHGQKVPILVRRLPSGEMEIVYGRRRLLACRILDINVRAVVLEMDDESALIAQGVENAQRLENSYIERALFVKQVLDAGFDLATVEQAIQVEATQASRMRGIVDAISLPVIRRIGAAHGVGRRPWEDLRKLIVDRSDLTETGLLDLIRTDLPSPERLADLIERLKPVRPPSPTATPARKLFNGRVSADLSGKRLTLRVGSAKDAHLLALIEARLTEIIAEIETSEMGGK
jgi:ParB family transcriptional regulator, chromosome partitioning protein